ncbi:hypothetical protein Tcan_08497 [Toxocara canis]|uniref:Uncharacterized protein n=1 Tax=Toxocara canis TaxID=6265 RepID=A0A0B2VIZ5_TOXCA|nr:hypothetical protein Tcan_08497 [Toxocara canis]
MGLVKWLSEWRREALPRINTRSLLSYYLPVTGAVSHTLYTIHIFSPQILSRSNIALKSVVATALSWLLLSRGHQYLKYLDKRSKRRAISKGKQTDEST